MIDGHLPFRRDLAAVPAPALCILLFLAVPCAQCTAAPQSDDYLCGPRCVAFCARWLGRKTTVEEATRLTATDRLTGSSLAGLAAAVNSLGLEGRCYRLSLPDLRRLGPATPGIAHVGGAHFVVVWPCESGGLWTVEPPFGHRRMTYREFGLQWNGAILVVSRGGEQPTWPGVPKWLLFGVAAAAVTLTWAWRRGRAVA